MGVHHRGHMSPHPAWVKIAILEFLEARLKDAAEEVDGIEPEDVHVYDPFTTEWDFYIIVDASWSDYLKLYSKYYDEDLETKTLQSKLPTPAQYASVYPAAVRTKIARRIDRAINDIRANEGEELNPITFNASTSKTEIYYTIQEMRDILESGDPYPPPPPV